MSFEDLPNDFFRPTKKEILDQWLKDYLLWQPGAPVGKNSQANIDGTVVSDSLLPVYADAVAVARDRSLDDKTLEGLKTEARGMGIPEQLPAGGAAGFVKIRASTGGVLIEDTRLIKDETGRLTFRCALGQTYTEDMPVPIVGVTTGPETNLPAGTVLRWVTTPLGLGATATVIADSNGDGLTGGRTAETADDIRRRIKAHNADPPAAGNSAHLRSLVKRASVSLGIAIQEVFAYPAIDGGGTISYCFTLRPAKPGGSRAPNATHIALILASVVGSWPGASQDDDSLIAASIVESPISVVLKVKWAEKTVGWADSSPWPIVADDFYVMAVTSPIVFTVKSLAVAPTAPVVGKSFAFYDKKAGKFVAKRVGGVAAGGGAGEYIITCDTTNNASDTLYSPAVNERLCPWSASLDSLVKPLLLESDELGPGEQVASFFDEGYRQHRSPEDPVVWPATIRHKILDGVDDLPQVGDVVWHLPALPYVTPVGVAGVSSTLTTIGSLLIFPL